MSITINGVTYEGNSISIGNNQVIIDGQEIRSAKKDKTINIEVHGDLESFQVDRCNKIIINGNVGDLRNGSGDLSISGNVYDKVNSGSGDVTVEGDVNGDVNTGSGDCTVKGDVFGKVKTGSGNFNGEKVYIDR